MSEDKDRTLVINCKMRKALMRIAGFLYGQSATSPLFTGLSSADQDDIVEAIQSICTLYQPETGPVRIEHV